MAASTAINTNSFTTIRAEGALLPPDLLRRIADADLSLEGLTPESYHLSGQRLNEAINQHWNTLQGAWVNFQTAWARLSDEDPGTSITRERWLLPLFSELGYGRLPTAPAVEIEGRSYPISHQYVFDSTHVPVHLVGVNVPLDRRTPGVAGAAASSPHSLVQVFLNRSDDNLWGFVSNGLRLRVLRDNASLTRQAYLEFDLQAMMDGEVYSDFVLLWLVCHQSRVEAGRDAWLERWAKTAQEQGTRALDQLRDGVEKAITALGSGFLDHPSNSALRDRLQSGALSKQDYYRQLLRMVYRLLVLFVAEDRDLLYDPKSTEAARKIYAEHYSTRRLRQIAARLKGTRHTDLYEGLRLIMRLLGGDGDASLLGLPVLGSFLFSEGAVSDLSGGRLENGFLLEAVRALAFTEDKALHVSRAVDYKNIGPEEFGSVYESLLELHPQINVDARTFELSTAAGSERKTTGSYYTPTSLVNALLDSALDPVIDEALKKARIAPTLNPSPSGGGTLKMGRTGATASLPSSEGGTLAMRGTGSTASLPASGEDASTMRGTGATDSFSPPPEGEGQGVGAANDEKIREMASRAMVHIARELRQRQTPAETILWECLRKNRLGGLNFRRQHPIANTQYVVDFFCYEAQLAIELDGPVHQYQQQADNQRQRSIEALGYTVLRFSNQRIADDLQAVLSEVLSTANVRIAARRNLTKAIDLQVPPPQGEGFRVGAVSPAEAALLNLKVCDPACGSGHFLIAAAHRIARALAQVRTGEDEPAPAATRHALRDVIGHCIYGVDVNPMAAELCKVNLWMEALEPGKPLSFLDHRIQVGNSLLGTTPKLMAGGIPDDAFTPIEGDDKAVASELKKQNKKDRKDRETGQRRLDYTVEPPADYAALTSSSRALDDLPDDTLAAIRAKEARYQALADDPEYQKARLLADAWCAAFVWEKRKVAPTPSPSPSGRGEPEAAGNNGDLIDSGSLAFQVPPPEGEGFRMGAYPLTDMIYRRMERDLDASELRHVRAYVVRLAEQYQFFHWHVAFPDVFDVPDDLRHAENEQTGWNGGFDCVLGNPPWEQIQLDDREFFSVSEPDIAQAENMTERKRMIVSLQATDLALYTSYIAAVRHLDGMKHLLHASGKYPLTSFGRLNLAPLFAESALSVINDFGQSGLILPTGIATDSFNQYFFSHIIDTRCLVTLYDFENREEIFPAIDNRTKFCLLTLAGRKRKLNNAQFVFFATRVSEINDTDKRFSLSSEDIKLLNPNTRTTPIFRTPHDAQLAKALYSKYPILINEVDTLSPWEAEFSLMFMMNTASVLFRKSDQLSDYGLRGNIFSNLRKTYLPLFEGKMIDAFDHRSASVVISETAAIRQGQSEYSSLEQHRDPLHLPMPRYWVDKTAVTDVVPERYQEKWLIGFKDVTSVTNERTVIASFLPFTAVGHTLPIIYLLGERDPILSACFLVNLNCFTFDYVARQKVGGNHLTFGYIKQLPFISPSTYTAELTHLITPYVLELTYTAWDLQAFAQDVGYDGPPFVWDDARRFLMRCELDALYFHLYGLARDDVDYIMETFPIVKRKDEAAHGEYRTKRVILEMYDQMAALPKMAVPAPKGEGEMLVPDVSQWITWLNPPPADPSVAHPAQG